MEIEQTNNNYSNNQLKENKTKKAKKKLKIKLDDSKDESTEGNIHTKQNDPQIYKKIEFVEEKLYKYQKVLSPVAQSELAHSQSLTYNDNKKKSNKNKYFKLNSVEKIKNIPDLKEKNKSVKSKKIPNKSTNNKNHNKLNKTNKSNNKNKIQDDKIDLIHKFNVIIYTTLIQLYSPQRKFLKCFQKWKKLLNNKRKKKDALAVEEMVLVN